MSDKQTFIDVLNSIAGGMGTTLISASMGRLMWHVGQVRKSHRRFWSLELMWEVPLAIGMAIIGEGAAGYLRLEQPVSTGLIAALAYLGPRGAEVLFIRWFGAKTAAK